MLLTPETVQQMESSLAYGDVWLANLPDLWHSHDLGSEMRRAIGESRLTVEHKVMFLLIVLEAHYAEP